jgi:hypothetical protein
VAAASALGGGGTGAVGAVPGRVSGEAPGETSGIEGVGAGAGAVEPPGPVVEVGTRAGCCPRAKAKAHAELRIKTPNEVRIHHIGRVFRI